MNKYLKIGLIEIIVGIGAVYAGYLLKIQENNWYKPLMFTGVLLFCTGFLTLIYRFVRKIDRSSILESRKEENNHASED